MKIPGDKNKIIYLGSPYSHDSIEVVNLRHKQICTIAANMMLAGKVVFSPIAHTHEMARLNNLDAEWSDFWKRQCLAMVEACDEFGVVKLDGWTISNGLIAEAEYAKHIMKPIYEIDPKDWL
jgi:hypothetical protein